MRPTRSRPFAAGLVAVLIFALVTIALAAKPSLVHSFFGARAESLAGELDEAIGATVEPLDAATARSLQLTPGTDGLVVTSISNDGPAARAAIQVGDVIIGVGRPVGGTRDLASGLRTNGRSPMLILMRNGRSVIVPFRVGPHAGKAAPFAEERR